MLDEYSPALIEEMLAVVTASTVMAYSLYTFTAETCPGPLRDNHLMMLTIPFVLYGIFRYLYLVYQKDEGSSPEEVLFATGRCSSAWSFGRSRPGALLYVFSPLSGFVAQLTHPPFTPCPCQARKWYNY